MFIFLHEWCDYKWPFIQLRNLGYFHTCIVFSSVVTLQRLTVQFLVWFRFGFLCGYFWMRMFVLSSYGDEFAAGSVSRPPLCLPGLIIITLTQHSSFVSHWHPPLHLTVFPNLPLLCLCFPFSSVPPFIAPSLSLHSSCSSFIQSTCHDSQLLAPSGFLLGNRMCDYWNRTTTKICLCHSKHTVQLIAFRWQTTTGCSLWL